MVQREEMVGRKKRARNAARILPTTSTGSTSPNLLLMKNWTLLLGLLFAASVGFAQSAFDQTVFMHYTLNPVLINPAAAGHAGIHQVYGNFRSQWTGFPGSPNSYGINYNGPIGETIGIGAWLTAEEIGSLQRNSIRFNFSNRFELGNEWALAAGFTAEFQNERLNNAVGSSTLVDLTDDLVMQGMDGTSLFDATLGFHATHANKSYIGLSFPNLILARLGEIESSEPRGGFFSYYIVTAGTRFEVSSGNVILEPVVMFQDLERAPFRLDANLLAHFLEGKLTTGVSYRVGRGGSLGLLLGTKIEETFSVYYSYDVGFQRFQQYNSGGHEITLGFEFGPRGDRYDRVNRF